MTIRNIFAKAQATTKIPKKRERYIAVVLTILETVKIEFSANL